MSLADSLKGFVPEPQTALGIKTPAAVKKPRSEKPAPQQRTVGKSRNPQFQKLGVYVREETRKAVAIKLLQEGQGRELSELVEKLLSDWASKRLDA